MDTKSEKDSSPRLAYRKFRAPREDRALLLEPAWPACMEMPSVNARTSAAYDFSLLGYDYQALKQAARHELLSLARDYMGCYTDVVELRGSQAELDAKRPIVLTGHQPHLFHPGVWAKNFAIDRIARENEALAVQVVIDNDAFRSHSILCPAGTFEAPVVASESFDVHAPPMPYEARCVQDFSVLETFAQRVAQRLTHLVPDPLVHRLWPTVLEKTHEGYCLGHAVAMARHRIEKAWGLNTLEVPLSKLCETKSFRVFALDWFIRAERNREIYNRRLAEYRTVHKIRNHAQPLPDLDKEGDWESGGWIETPFWIWTDEDPTRRAVWVRQTAAGIELSNREATWCCNRDDLLDGLQRHASDGLRLRPRALANTLFLRLFCSDAFVHGIGGAKYDQVTDLIAHDVFGVEPPGFAVLSLTTLLPSPNRLVGLREIIHKQAQIRQMHFHPERFLGGDLGREAQVSSKVKIKSKLIRQKPIRGQAKQWHNSLAAINDELRDFLQGKTLKEKKNLLKLQQQQEATSLLGSREWSICLFDDEFLRTRLLDLK